MQRTVLLSVSEDRGELLGCPIETVSQLSAFLAALGLPRPEFVGRTELMAFGVTGDALAARVTHEPQQLVSAADRIGLGGPGRS